jgi:LmbE family N-acetylglucosaminyl deacetylase
MSTALVIAPHADDETLGMGATIARLSAEGTNVVVAIMTGHGAFPHPLWPEEVWTTVRAEARQACEILGVKTLYFDELPAVTLDHLPRYQTNARLQRLVDEFAPASLYLPFLHDLHGDHGALTYAGLVASRPYLQGSIKFVAMYETPTETHLMPASIAAPFAPNRYLDVSAHFRKKIEAWACYRSQHQDGQTPRSDEALTALAIWRGAHIGVKYAEAFQVLHETV